MEGMKQRTGEWLSCWLVDMDRENGCHAYSRRIDDNRISDRVCSFVRDMEDRAS